MQKMATAPVGVSGIVARALTLVEKVQGAGQHKVDASHDSFHVLRVLATARRLADEERRRGVAVDETVVDLAAVLHDVDDWKYRAPTDDPSLSHAQQFLEGEKEVTEEMRHAVLEVIRNMGFKEQLSSSGQRDHAVPLRPELAIVQDADRLDAIGAIGVARTFTFSGAKRPGTPLYDPSCPPRTTMTKEEYVSNPNGSAINHFHEKLLKLKDMMNTETGKRMAEKRHAFMLQFLDQFNDEWNGDS
ncbi:HD domain containing protein [Acanthamoeba castellanii str. Neff]|uniref:HD domain containing protein n=1 Tax=Acanthamoeba castellanii (strain ATCC 30010 / Neff) TaxID=1257118 RepID=L8HGN4_ACACF|nr:HD domain containing protein [Acanthamoeba castellanii str. Neff]ELR24325.1 HD domain containing protein [Acanthamoeba castellanii str. Neff]